MKEQILKVSFVLYLSLGFVSNGTAQDTASPDYEIEKETIEQSIGWAIEKDFDNMFRLWDENMFHFWLFSNSIVVGLDSFKIYAEQWKDPNFRGTCFEFKLHRNNNLCRAL